MNKRALVGVAFPLAVSMLLAGCASNNFDDLDQFMAEVRALPRQPIEPIPPFTPYRPFNYSATAMRAPFDRPIPVEEAILVKTQATDVEPDWDRQREYLEEFNLEALTVVGSLSRDGDLWMLIDDGSGRVHMVREGNYLGRNHGRIVEVSESHISIIEIVPDGEEGWLERPRTLGLRESR